MGIPTATGTGPDWLELAPTFWLARLNLTGSIPDVTGKTQDDAVTALDDVGLKAAGISASSSTVPKGQVISQQPTAGTTAKTGDTVTLTISSGS